MNQSEFEANTYDRSQAPNACEQGTIGFETFDKHISKLRYSQQYFAQIDVFIG